MSIHPELKKAIADNELVIFVGAGLSFNLKNTDNQLLQGWSNLVTCMLEDLKSKEYDVDHLKPLIKRIEPIKVLELIESDSMLPKSKIHKFVKTFFELNDKTDFSLHKKITKLSNKIITTNYDTAFEQSDSNLRINKAYKGKNFELTLLKEKETPILFKLHGCIEDADSMVLFPSNYKDLYENPHRDAQHTLMGLRNIIFNKTILFIGVGMGDIYINNIFEEIKLLQGNFNQKHFIVSTYPLDSSLTFLTRIPIRDHSEINTILDEFIQLKSEAKENESPEVKTLKKQLEESKNKIIELESLPSKELNQLQVATRKLEIEANKYFLKGLRFSLENEYRSANEEYKQASNLKPDFHEAFNNWGNDLGNLAQTKEVV